MSFQRTLCWIPLAILSVLQYAHAWLKRKQKPSQTIWRAKENEVKWKEERKKTENRKNATKTQLQQRNLVTNSVFHFWSGKLTNIYYSNVKLTCSCCYYTEGELETKSEMPFNISWSLFCFHLSYFFLFYLFFFFHFNDVSHTTETDFSILFVLKLAKLKEDKKNTNSKTIK